MKNDGGPAFPQYGNSAIERNLETGLYQDMMNHGMSLRDFFAGQAMRCVYEIVADVIGKEPPQSGEETVAQITARYAYEYADAMLKERDK